MRSYWPKVGDVFTIKSKIGAPNRYDEHELWLCMASGEKEVGLRTLCSDCKWSLKDPDNWYYAQKSVYTFELVCDPTHERL